MVMKSFFTTKKERVMNELFLTPYTLVENKDYPIDNKIIIRASDFSNVPFQDGGVTLS
jgi:hypothetical protein